MKEYVITFRRFKNNCRHVFDPTNVIRTRHACIRRINMEWVKSEDHKKHIECSESNCPILEKLEQVIV